MEYQQVTGQEKRLYKSEAPIIEWNTGKRKKEEEKEKKKIC